MFNSHERIRNGLWFGTEEKMGWFQTPLAGADTSPQGYGTDGTLVNGGGYVFNSVGSHKRYLYEWAGTSVREVAQKMKSYADGSYGRGLIYFVDPLTYNTNVLPARVADPSMTAAYEGGSLVYGVEPTLTPAVSGDMDLPVTTTNFDLTDAPAGFDKQRGAVFIPIPSGYRLLVGAVYSSTGSGGIFASTQNTAKTITGTSTLTKLSSGGGVLLSDSFYGVAGIWLWVGKSASGAAAVSVQAMSARLIAEEDFVAQNTNYHKVMKPTWVGGQGHSGAKFAAKPTYIENGGIGGGMVGFAASFVEVGSWSVG